MARDDVAIGIEKRTLPLADSAELRRALDEAEVHTALMVYVHLTHDESMLDAFAPHFRPLNSAQVENIPEELVADLKQRLLTVLTTAGAAKTGPLPKDLMQRMMSVGVAEKVEDEFIPLLLEQMGFEKPTPRKLQPERKANPQGFKVLVIGAGLTGLVAGIKLEEAGYDYVIIEKNPDVGSTWYENTYPGVGVDTPSHFYSYSFELNPDWNHYYPKGGDMQSYFLRVADKYDLRRKTRFETTVVSCVFDEATGLWSVTVRKKAGSEEVIQANAVINAHGPVNRWSWPKIPGLDTFQGELMHTAGWKAGTDVKGKRVAVIGTAASSAQLVPAIAPDAAEVTVFQRSKHWVLYNPELGKEVTDATKWALRHIPHFFEWLRFRVYWATADGLYPNVVMDPEWKDNELSVSAHNEGIRQYCLSYIHSKFKDRPDLIEKLTPDYPVFGKRIVLDNGWIDSLLRDNVHLETESIERVLPNGIQLRDGRVVEADIIVCATGFDVANMVGNLTIIGRDQRNLGEEWGPEDPRSYYGVMVPGYPNFFLTVGPNSAPNHAAGQNMISEAQIHYIIECLDHVVASGARAVEPTVEGYNEWNAMIDARLPQMIWSHPKTKSYYKNSKGRNFMSFPFRLVDYWSWTRNPIKKHMRLL